MPTSPVEIDNPGGLIIRKLGGVEVSLAKFLATTKKGDHFLLFWKDFGKNKKRQRRISFFKFYEYDANESCLTGELCESLRLISDSTRDKIFLDELAQIQAGTGERATLLIEDLYKEINCLQDHLARIRSRAEDLLK